MTKTLHHRACHLCEAICGLTIETTATQDRVQITSIKGDTQDSFSRGHICPKAVALQDIQNDPDRLRQPMRRVGEQWQPIGWEEAFALVAERLAVIQQRHGQNAVALRADDPQQLFPRAAEDSQPLFRDLGRPVAAAPEQLPDVRSRAAVADSRYRSHRLHADPGRQPAGVQWQHHDRARRRETPQGDPGAWWQAGGGRSTA